MAPPDPPVAPDHGEVPLDKVRSAIKKIHEVISTARVASHKLEEIKKHLLDIEGEHLKMLDKLNDLETMERAHEQHMSRCQPAITPGPNNTRPSYSTVAAGTSSKPGFDPLCTIQIYPKIDPSTTEPVLNSPEATKRLLQTLNLKGKPVGIRHMKSIKGNGVSVLCRDPQEIKVLADVITTEQAANLQVKTLTKRNPTLTMLLRGKDHIMDDVKEDLMTRNDFLAGLDLDIVHHYGTKNGNTVVVISASSLAYRALEANDFKVYIGWACVSLREQEPITQCFKCMKFGHKSKNCRYSVNETAAVRCAKCGADHPDSSCNAALCCVNCQDFNIIAAKRKWSLLATDHAATNATCPMRAKAIARAKALINY